ncbi:MAG: hypothetical protein V4487_00295 [Chlamydiota bacterium]
MPKRATKKTKPKKARKPVKRKTVARKKTKSKRVGKKMTASNKKAQWDAYRSLQKKVDLAWDKLCSDAKKKCKPQILIRDKNHLLLLLGECNYMARECMRISQKRKKR